MRKVVLSLLLVSMSYSFDFSKSWTEIKDKDVIKQKYDFSCGAASVATVLTYFYKDVLSEEDVIKFMFGKKRLYYKKIKDLEEEDLYLSFKDIVDFLKHRGYKPVPIAVSIEELRYLKYPAIVYLKIRGFDHFSVFKGIDNEFVYLADPKFGNAVFPIERFKNYFYTRKNRRFPGKIIVVFSKKNFNPDFLKVERIKVDKVIKKVDINSHLISKPIIDSP